MGTPELTNGETSHTPDDLFKVPALKRSSVHEPSRTQDGEGIGGARQQHAFVKTSFSKGKTRRKRVVHLTTNLTLFNAAVICRVCQNPVKHRAVLCQECSLIAHSRCAADAPATCDIRAQLLLYAQYTQHPIDGASHPPLTIPVVENTPTTPSVHQESPLSSSPGGGFRIFSRKKSKQNYADTPDTSNPVTPTPAAQQADEESRKRLFFGRGRSSEERSRSRASLVSSSTPNSNSLRSTADQLESVINAHSRPTAAPKTNKRVSLPNPSDAQRAASRAAMPSSYSDVNSPEGRNSQTLSPDDPSFAKR